MKILLLGANGQLGQDILRYHHNHVSNTYMQPMTRGELNLFHPETIVSILSAIEFDILINCSAYTNVELAESDREKTYAINAHAVKSIAAVCQSKKARLIHISTDYVFDGAADIPYTEEDAVNPLNVYGQSKLYGESLAMQAHDDVIILRTASLFGRAGARGKGGNFLHSVLKKAKLDGELSVVHDQIMSPTWTYDLAEIIFTAIDRHIPAGIYHATSGGAASWYELAEFALHRLGIVAQLTAVSLREFPAQAQRPLYSALDCQRLDSLLLRQHHWQQGVEGFLVNLI